ncbi:MAG TPA: phage portal protein [Gemmatimonadales bacterium]|nr:phage portal protein [Gemmatimonadales bacterium]
MQRAWATVREQFQFPRTFGSLVRVWPANVPLTHPRDVRTLADEGYRKNVIIYRCIREMAESAAEPVLIARQTGSPDPLPATHPLSRLLAQPNDEQSPFELVETLITHQQISGSWYLDIERSRTGQPAELWPLRPDRVQIVPGPDGRIGRYEFTLDGQRVPLAPKDVIHDALLDPLDDYYGLSPIAVAALVADTDSHAMEWLRRFFLNAATPAGIIKLKKKVPPEKRREIKEKWDEQLRGAGGWHSVAVVDEDADYQSVGAPIKDINLTGILSETEARLCGVFGVPPIIVAAKLGLDRSTYANYEEARRSFWVETLRPMYRRFADRLTFAMRREFGPGIEVTFDFSKVGPLQESQEAVRKFAFLSWRDGLLTRNEARQWIGLPGVEHGDVFRQTTNDLFIKQGDLPPSEPVAARQGEEGMLPPAEGEGEGGNGNRLAALRDDRRMLLATAPDDTDE